MVVPAMERHILVSYCVLISLTASNVFILYDMNNGLYNIFLLLLATHFWYRVVQYFEFSKPMAWVVGFKKRRKEITQDAEGSHRMVCSVLNSNSKMALYIIWNVLC